MKIKKPDILKILFGGFILLVIAGYIGWYYYRNLQIKPVEQKPVSTQNKTGTTTPQKIKPVISPYYFPITNFDSRIVYRWFGKYVNSSDIVPDCGAVFTGYHDGDDLEVTSAEKLTDVPVYAVSDGTIRLVQHVSGYGGLLIIGVTINGQEYTINYGHIRLSSVPFKAGDSVKAGQKLAVLGEGCSAETNGERKHLHFAIHKGPSIDVAGYVQSLSALKNWTDPKALLDQLKPQNP